MNYQLMIRDAIARRDGKPVLNSTFEHASIIIQEMFTAGNEIRLLSSRLETACYARKELIDAACFFLGDPDHKLRLLVEPAFHGDENREWIEHPLISALGDLSSRIEMRAVPKTWTDKYRFNFALIDKFGFRFEADRSQPAAVAAFLPTNNAREVENLDSIFRTLWEDSTEIELEPAKRSHPRESEKLLRGSETKSSMKE